MRKVAVGLVVAVITMMTINMHARHACTHELEVEDRTTGAVLSFDTTTINLGNVITKNTPKVRTVFHFTNKGKAPLVLNKVQASCGCTQVTYPQKPISAGQKDSISVVYDSRRSSGGHFRKSIMVYSNAVQPATVIYLEGFVITD